MEKQNPEQRASRISNLLLEKLARIRRLATELVNEIEAEPGLGAAVTPSAVVHTRRVRVAHEIGFRVRIRFVGEKEVTLGGLFPPSCTSRAGALRRDVPLSDLSQEDLAALRQLEPMVLNWIAASEDNAVLFAADPVGALARVGVKVERRFLKNLQRVRNAHLAVQPSPPGMRLTSVTVEAKPTANRFSPNPELPLPNTSSQNISQGKHSSTSSHAGEKRAGETRSSTKEVDNGAL